MLKTQAFHFSSFDQEVMKCFLLLLTTLLKPTYELVIYEELDLNVTGTVYISSLDVGDILQFNFNYSQVICCLSSFG